MPGVTKITVAICTHNRSRLLRETLKTMEALRVPPDLEWELVVVDNNSMDETPDVIQSFAGRLPLKHVFEPETGKSHAANRAVQEATGELILWTDDDVRVRQDWLVAYHDAAQRHPKAGVFGGPIEAWFEGSPPRWLMRALPEVEGAYAILDLGPEEAPLSHDAYPYGANMALRRHLHLKAPFDTEIGPRPGLHLRGEEMQLIRTLLADGERGVWVPGARVRHFIPRDRQTVGYIKDYFFAAGRLLDYVEDAPGVRLLGRPLWLWREALDAEVRYRVLRVFGAPEEWIRQLRRSCVARGRLRGFGSLRKRGKSTSLIDSGAA